jgi:hypothetical protein
MIVEERKQIWVWLVKEESKRTSLSRSSGLEDIIVNGNPFSRHIGVWFVEYHGILDAKIGREVGSRSAHSDRSYLTISSKPALHRVDSSLVGRGSGLRQKPP